MRPLVFVMLCVAWPALALLFTNGIWFSLCTANNLRGADCGGGFWMSVLFVIVGTVLAVVMRYMSRHLAWVA